MRKWLLRNAAPGIAAAAMFAATAAAQEVAFKDPTGDDNGPGAYTYPTDTVYKPGSFDLTEFKMTVSGDKANFDVTVNSTLEDPWRMGGGFAVQMAFIFIDTDHKVGSGFTTGLPGLNVTFAAADAWDKCVILSPQGPSRVQTEVTTKAGAMAAAVLVPGRTKGAGRTISGAVDLAALGGGDPTSWGYQVLMQSNEGFPDAGDLLTRKVNEYEGQHRFGGGTDGDADPHVVDILAGNGAGEAAEADAQHTMLGYEAAPDGTPVRQAMLKMVYLSGHAPAAEAAAAEVAPAAEAAPAMAAPVMRPAAPAPATKLVMGGTTYTKWLWGTQRDSGSIYNFTTVPGEGYSDNGQGSEVELLLSAKMSKQVDVKARLHSRFNQNFWTNFGGFGGRNDITKGCTSGDCGEYDPRSNQYVKLRGVAVTLTPGYSWLDSATIGANDFGQFDPFVIGRLRYIDRDNAAGLLFQGSAAERKFTWDATRISLPRLWAGPNFNTGILHASDAAYGLQAKATPNRTFDVGAIFQYVNDQEVDARDLNLDDGRDLRFRFKNAVIGAKVGIHPSAQFDIRAAIYHSNSETDVDQDDTKPEPGMFGIAGFSPVIQGKHDDNIWKVNLDLNDPMGAGLSLNIEAFSFGADYASMMASRREADVLLTEGHDSAFAFPGPSNAAFGVFKGNPTRIGYGGWDGNAQQVATINVDNEFTDFDEPMAETAIGWKGVTVAPVYGTGAFDLAAEYTYLTYNTNWQAFGDDTRPILDSYYPTMEVDSGVGHNFRSAYAPFQDKTTHIALARFKYVANVGKGVDLFGKIKRISETDLRMNNPNYLPYNADGSKHYYFGSNTTADLYGAPPEITVNGVTGNKWKPFDSISDDDRDLSYTMLQIGAGYQLSSDLYGSLTYEYYNADLKDGNTAFQAYQLHEMASGKHTKNKLMAKFRYILAGAEFGLEWQYNFGTFDPDFGGGFVPQVASEQIAADHNVPVGSLGFEGRFGGWNSLESRDFTQNRLKAFMKVQF